MNYQNVQTDYQNALRAGEKQKVAVLRLMVSAIKNEVIALGHELSDDEFTAVLKRMINSRNDSIEAFRKGKAEDRALAEQYEIDVITPYLPAQLSDDELEAAIIVAFAEVKPTSIKQMGLVLKYLKATHGNTFDCRKAYALVTARLA